MLPPPCCHPPVFPAHLISAISPGICLLLNLEEGFYESRVGAASELKPQSEFCKAALERISVISAVVHSIILKVRVILQT